jgi:UDP-2-acetamido-3-amino-2,3-dideoxy-glucuronate N-acetyltransferase
MSEAPFSAHATALVETERVGEGTQIWAFAHIMNGAVVGEACKIGDHAFIESGASIGDRVVIKNGCLIWHGVHIGDDVFVGPNVVFTNVVAPRARYQTTADDWITTEVADRATLGANSTIVCGVRIGVNVTVGAGSVVIEDVPDHALVVGNPSRQIGWACDCGTKLEGELVCANCGRCYEHTQHGLREIEGSE